MTASWRIKTPGEIEAEFGGPLPALRMSPPRREEKGSRWALFLGPEAAPLARAAAAWIAGQARQGGLREVFLPPDGPALPLAVGRLSAPESRGTLRAVFVLRLDRAFYNTLSGNTSFSLTSPLYLLPKLVRAAGGEPLHLAATAIEGELSSRGPEVLAGRGMAARFEVHRALKQREAGGEREAGAGPEQFPQLPERYKQSLETEISSERLLELGLATRDPAFREKAYRRAVSLDRGSALSHLCLASAFSEQGRLEEAASELREAIRLDPELDAAHYELGKVLIRSDDLEGAVRAFRRAADILPEFAPAWSNLGASLGELQDLTGAAEALQRAVALDALSHVLHNNLGVTLRNQGRLEESEAEFKAVLSLAPDFVFGHYNLAHTYYLQGRHPEAIATFERARDMDVSKTPRQGLLLALARLASGDGERARQEYRDILGRLEGRERADMVAMAEWDLRQLARTRRDDPVLRETLAVVHSLA